MPSSVLRGLNLVVYYYPTLRHSLDFRVPYPLVYALINGMCVRSTHQGSFIRIATPDSLLGKVHFSTREDILFSSAPMEWLLGTHLMGSDTPIPTNVGLIALVVN